MILFSMVLFLFYYGMLLFGLLYMEFVLSFMLFGGLFYGVSYVVGLNGDNVIIEYECELVCVFGCCFVDMVCKLVVGV